MSADVAFLFPCDGCGAELDARDEAPEDHEPDCPVRLAKWGVA